MRIAFAVFFLILVTGCGPGKRSIEGTVTLDDAPLEQGSITFTATDVREGGIIKAGKFRVELPDGTYDVQILTYRVIGKTKEKYMNEWTELEKRKDIKSEHKAEVNASTRKLEFAIQEKK